MMKVRMRGIWLRRSGWRRVGMAALASGDVREEGSSVEGEDEGEGLPNETGSGGRSGCRLLV